MRPEIPIYLRLLARQTSGEISAYIQFSDTVNVSKTVELNKAVGNLPVNSLSLKSATFKFGKATRKI